MISNNIVYYYISDTCIYKYKSAPSSKYDLNKRQDATKALRSAHNYINMNHTYESSIYIYIYVYIYIYTYIYIYMYMCVNIEYII